MIKNERFELIATVIISTFTLTNTEDLDPPATTSNPSYI
jgi:hypothetical protein